jgi:hypothetical protein
MSRRTETETLTLLREIRDLVQVLVLREIQNPAQFADLSDEPSRKLFSWASIHRSLKPRSEK